jgi:hypothetical protein
MQFLNPLKRALTLALFLLSASIAFGQTVGTRIEQVAAPDEPGIPHYLVQSDPTAPIVGNPPRVGIPHSPDAPNDSSISMRAGSPSSAFPYTDVWLQNNMAQNDLGDPDPWKANEETSIAQKGQDIVVMGLLDAYRSDDGGATWHDSPIPDGTNDPSIVTAPNNNHPHTFYAVYIAGPTTVRVRQSDDGGKSWTKYIDITTGTGLDYPQAIVDNQDRIWISWSGGIDTHHWVIVDHDSNFDLISNPSVKIGLPREINYTVDRLVYDPVLDQVYCVGTRPAGNFYTANVYVALMNPGVDGATKNLSGSWVINWQIQDVNECSQVTGTAGCSSTSETGVLRHYASGSL